MKHALASATAALALLAGLTGCGDDDDEVPAVVPGAPSDPSPAAGALSGADVVCKDEIVRQMNDASQETEDVPPECEGISDERLLELARIADGEAE